MRIHIHHHIEPSPEVLARLDVLNRKLDLIIQKENVIMTAIDDALTQAEAAAKSNSDAEDAVQALLTTLSKQISDLKAAGTDPATVTRITALSDSLTARAAALSAAVVANTPAATP